MLRSATRAVTGRWQRIVTMCSVVACLMTLVVVGTAIHRLGLYQDAYGLTMLRLACTLFAWWLGAVFLLVAVRLAGVGGPREWLPMAVVASALVALLVWNAVDPEALVVRTNVDRAVAGERFDPTYLSNLSDDAVPTIAAALPRLRCPGPGGGVGRDLRRPVPPRRLGGRQPSPVRRRPHPRRALLTARFPGLGACPSRPYVPESAATTGARASTFGAWTTW